MTDNLQRCIAPRCGAANPDTGDYEVREAISGAYLCKHHSRRLTDALAEIPDLYAELDPAIESTQRYDSGPKAKYQDPPAPIRLDVVAMLDPRTTWTGEGPMNIIDAMTGWARIVCEERNLDEQPFGILTNLAQFLTRHHDWIIQQPWIDDYLDEITEALRQLRTATGTRGRQRIGRCYLWNGDNQCDGSLIQHPDGTTRCDRCAEEWRTPRERAILAVALSSSSSYSTSTEAG